MTRKNYTQHVNTMDYADLTEGVINHVVTEYKGQNINDQVELIEVVDGVHPTGETALFKIYMLEMGAPAFNDGYCLLVLQPSNYCDFITYHAN